MRESENLLIFEKSIRNKSRLPPTWTAFSRVPN